MKAILLIALLLVSPLANSAQELDLNGFRLWQLKDAIRHSFKKQNREIDTERSTVEIYELDKHSYMAFEYSKIYPNHVSTIQLTGKNERAHIFKGLKLGDKAEKVVDILGKPTEIDKISKPNYQQYYYDNANYSIEFDDNQKLYSIRLSVTKEIMELERVDKKYWERFEKAVKSRNLNSIIDRLMPDVEIYIDGKTLSIGRKYSEFLKAPGKQFQDVMLNSERSVYIGLKESKSESRVRIFDKQGIGMVHQFPEGKVLSEIVFLPYNGEFRVWEIKFKDIESNK